MNLHYSIDILILSLNDFKKKQVYNVCLFLSRIFKPVPETKQTNPIHEPTQMYRQHAIPTTIDNASTSVPVMAYPAPIDKDSCVTSVPVMAYPVDPYPSAPPFYPAESYPIACEIGIPVAKAIPVFPDQPNIYSETSELCIDTSILLDVMKKNNIGPEYLEELMKLTYYDIVILCDDSTSMNRLDGEGGKSRWEELKNSVSTVVDIATALDDDGIEVEFFHRDGAKNVKQLDQVTHLFHDAPLRGQPTPLTKRTKHLLLIIATDGLPSDGRGYATEKALADFKELLENKNHSQAFISFLACTNNEAEIGYLNKMDRSIPGIDVIDDYRSEMEEVREKQGPDYIYSYGDHKARLLIGPISHYDLLDGDSLNITSIISLNISIISSRP